MNHPAEQLSEKRLHIGGYLYSRSFQRNGSTYWDCLKVRDKLCRARAVTSINGLNELMVERGPAQSEHSHAPTPDAVEAEKIKFRIKRVAADNRKRPPSAVIRGILKLHNFSQYFFTSVIFSKKKDELAGVSGAVIANLPERENLKKSVQRERKKTTPSNPKRLVDLGDIPEKYRRTLSGDNFLLYDSKAHEEIPEGRVLVFATKRNIQVLRECEDWYVDGTFKVSFCYFEMTFLLSSSIILFVQVSPNIFTQLFTILGGVPRIPGDATSEKVPLPLVYALLSSKEEEQYTAVLDAVLSAADDYRIEELRPENVMSDFELAIINAITAAFPDVNVQLCYFHLKQSSFRHISELGLRVPYVQDVAVREYFHMMAGLAYVPVREVKTAYRLLIREAPDVPRIDEFNSYFNATYVNGVPGAGQRPRVPPRFAPDTWNIYDATLQERAATNNASEGWHNRFMQMVAKNHPDIYTLIDELQQEQGDTEIAILELRMGRKIKAAPKKKWLDHHRRVRDTVRGYPTYGRERILEYLRIVSHHISFD